MRWAIAPRAKLQRRDNDQSMIMVKTLLRMKHAGNFDITVRGFFKHAIEPVVKSCRAARASCFCPFGFNNMAASAGLKDSALNADSMTEMTMVSANCW